MVCGLANGTLRARQSRTNSRLGLVYNSDLGYLADNPDIAIVNQFTENELEWLNKMTPAEKAAELAAWSVRPPETITGKIYTPFPPTAMNQTRVTPQRAHAWAKAKSGKPSSDWPSHQPDGYESLTCTLTDVIITGNYATFGMLTLNNDSGGNLVVDFYCSNPSASGTTKATQCMQWWCYFVMNGISQPLGGYTQQLPINAAPAGRTINIIAGIPSEWPGQYYIYKTPIFPAKTI